MLSNPGRIRPGRNGRLLTAARGRHPARSPNWWRPSSYCHCAEIGAAFLFPIIAERSEKSDTGAFWTPNYPPAKHLVMRIRVCLGR